MVQSFGVGIGFPLSSPGCFRVSHSVLGWTLHFELSLDASSLRSDVISSIGILSLLRVRSSGFGFSFGGEEPRSRDEGVRLQATPLGNSAQQRPAPNSAQSQFRKGFRLKVNFAKDFGVMSVSQRISAQSQFRKGFRPNVNFAKDVCPKSISQSQFLKRFLEYYLKVTASWNKS